MSRPAPSVGKPSPSTASHFPRPCAGEELVRLLTEEWWTRETAATDPYGEVRVRGFFGDYKITVEHAGRVLERSAVLTGEGALLEVRLP